MNEHTMAVMFATGKDDQSTPQHFFDHLDQEFHFDLDVCASAENAKCARYFTVADDALKQDWTGTCWMNPPYSQLNLWIKKAWEESQKGATVVCLIPARTDTASFHDYALQGEIRFVRGRLKFNGAKTSAPFPSIVVVFRPPVAKAA